MATTVKHLAMGLVLALLTTANAVASSNETAPKLNTISTRSIMSKSSEYADKYAEAAMEQMRRYGIPASVTLAQGILESASGQSELSRKGNNHFGIKATSSWLQNGGRYLVYTDDKPNEKFCQYASVSDSYEHHSLFLKSNSRYSGLFSLSPDDYVGWTNGLQSAGYATSKQYAASLQSVIKANGLDKYDQMVMQEQGWQSTKGQTTSTEQLAARSQSSPSKDGEGQKESEVKTDAVKEQTPEKPKDKDFFNTILSSTDTDDSWKKFFGSEEGGSYYGMDPIVEIASTMFAGLMALAVQIDNMGNAQEVQQSSPVQGQSAAANSLASQNFENAMNSMNNNTIKRTRS